jgi:hypothetical protein
VLIGADVESLYPSIDIVDGLQQLHKGITQYNDQTNNTITTDTISFILDLASWVLNNNYIEFGQNNYYRQTKGTAMGTPFAVTFACIYMSMLEQEVIHIMKQQQIIMYIALYRYIDDIFAIFHTIISARMYMSIFNSLREGIIILKLTHIGDSVDILDLTVSKGERFTQTQTLDINLFQKPFNKYLYLPLTSYHRITTFTSFITSELTRYRISCSNNNNYNTIKLQFFERLLSRGYDINFITPLFSTNVSRDTMISNCIIKQQLNKNKQQNSYKSTPRLTMCTINTPRQHKINLRECLTYDDFIWADPCSNLLFGHNNKAPQITYKRTENIGDILTESKYKFVIGETQNKISEISPET